MLVLGLMTMLAALPAHAQEAGGLDAMSLEELLNMEVTTASKSSEKLSDAPGIVSVVTRDELDRFGGTTLRDILERIPGLIGSTAYMTDRTTISARGDQSKINSSHVLLLVDGRPVRETLEGGIGSDVYETFPVGVIEQIEVIKGPGSVLYGSDAFSAVINIITRRAERTGLAVSGYGGHKGAFGGSAEATVRTGDLAVVVAARYYEKAEWQTTWHYNDFLTGEDVSAAVEIPNRGVNTFVGAGFKGLRLSAMLDRYENAYFVGNNNAYGEAEWKRSFANLGYGLQVGGWWDMDWNVTLTNTRFAVSAFPDIERDAYDLVGEWTNSMRLSEQARVTFGGLFNRIQGEELFFGAGPKIVVSDDHRSGFGFYSQLDYQLLEQLKVIGGLQANKVENIDLDLVPRAGLIWYPAPRINVKALYSQAFRAPSINETGLQHPSLSGNPNLTPEKVATTDIGVSYLGASAQVGVNYFHSRQTDIIIPVMDGERGQYGNAGELTFHGVEFEAKYYVDKRLFFTGSMLYQSNEDGNGARNVTPIAGFGAKTGVSYRSDRGVTASLFDVYQGALDASYDAVANPDPGAYHLVSLHLKLDANRLFDLGAGPSISFFVQVDNLLDKQIWLPEWGLTTGETIPVNQGRAVYFGLNAAI